MKTIEFSVVFNDPQSTSNAKLDTLAAELKTHINIENLRIFGGTESNKKRLMLRTQLKSALIYKAACIKYIHLIIPDAELSSYNIKYISDSIAKIEGVQKVTYHGEIISSTSLDTIKPEGNPLFFDQQHLFLSPLGVDSMYGWTIPGGTGKNVNVFISDFGLHDNPDLSIENISGKTEDSNHGTGMASVVGADNNTLSIIGCAYEAKMFYIWFGDLDKVIPHAKAGDVVNISGSYIINGIEYPFISYRENMIMVATLAEMGVTCCYSSGNINHNLDDVTDDDGEHFLDKNSTEYASSDAICVGGYNGGINLRRIYAGGSLVDVFALAYNVPVLWGDGYSYQSGTSVASPIIAGLIAQIQSILIENGDSPLKPSEIKTLISDENHGVRGVSIYDSDKAVMPDLRKILSSLSITTKDDYVSDYGISESELNSAKANVHSLFSDDLFTTLNDSTSLKDISESKKLINALKPGATKLSLLQLLTKADDLIGATEENLIVNSDFSKADNSWVFINGNRSFSNEGVTIETNSDDSYLGLAYASTLYFSTSSNYELTCEITISELDGESGEVIFGAVFPGAASIWAPGMTKSLSIDLSQINTIQTISVGFIPFENSFVPKFPCLYITGVKKATIKKVSCHILQ